MKVYKTKELKVLELWQSDFDPLGSFIAILQEFGMSREEAQKVKRIVIPNISSILVKEEE